MNINSYQKAWAEHRANVQKANDNPADRSLKREKEKTMQTCRAMEREAAREGVVIEGGKQLGTCPPKRELQSEYVRRFDAEKKVVIGGKETTLRDHHARRLLGA